MNCLIGHTPHAGFAMKWRVKKYKQGEAQRQVLYRAHVCEKCGVRFFEFKPVDRATAQALEEAKPQT